MLGMFPSQGAPVRCSAGSRNLRLEPRARIWRMNDGNACELNGSPAAASALQNDVASMHAELRPFCRLHSLAHRPALRLVLPLMRPS